MKYIFIILMLLVVVMSVPSFASAQERIPDERETLLGNGPAGLVGLIKTITNWLFTFLLALAVLFIILAAYKYLISGGGEEVGKAHKMLIYAAVAIAVAFLAKGIVFVVEELVTSGNSGGSSNVDNGNGSLQIQYQNRNFGGGIDIGL